MVPILSITGNVRAGDSVLIHAGASGVGTAAIQLARMAGATPLVTAGSQEKLQIAEKLGAASGMYRFPVRIHCSLRLCAGSDAGPDAHGRSPPLPLSGQHPGR